MANTGEAPIHWQPNIDVEDARFIKRIAEKWAKKVRYKLETDLDVSNGRSPSNPTPHLSVLNCLPTWLPVFTQILERAILGRVIDLNEETPTGRLAFPKDEREFAIRANGSADLLLQLLPPIYSEPNLKSSMGQFYQDFCKTTFEVSRARFNPRGAALPSP